MPLWKLLGGTREKIDCGVSIGIQPSIEKLLAKIDTEVNAGYRRIKIKIKPGWDVEVVRQVREAFPKILLMGDANSAYTLADIELFRKMDKYDMMMFEQPLHHEDMIDHAELQKQIQTPVCLDESIHSAEDARKAIQIGACRIINIKLGRVGGHAEFERCTMSAAIMDSCVVRRHARIGHRARAQCGALEPGEFSLPGDVSASKRYWAEDIVEPPVEVSAEGQITQRSPAWWCRPVRESRFD